MANSGGSRTEDTSDQLVRLAHKVSTGQITLVEALKIARAVGRHEAEDATDAP